MTTESMPTADAAALLSKSYRRYALGLLLVIYILDFLDRQVINILAEPIKQDLGLADWQMGMMTGLAFGLFYTVLGLPIARVADRANRPWIIAAAVAWWSAFTMLCGAAQNFRQLILARIGVGVGEAGCTPPAHSLICDYVPREERASALAFYSMGMPIGSLLGMVMGGLIADHWGWRAAFLVAGAPSVVIAIVAATTLIEPRRRLAADLTARAAKGPTFAAALKELSSKRTFWLIAFAAALMAFIGYGHSAFNGSFFFRNHGEQLAGMAADFGLKAAGFLGLALGLITGCAGVLGTLLGGHLADRFGARDLRAYVVVPAAAALVGVPFYIWAMLVKDVVLALGLLAIPTLLNTLRYGPVYAAAQGLVQPHTRATAAAVMLFVINLIGLGLGPLSVGVLSDLLAGPAGLGAAEGVQWAQILSTAVTFIAVALFWMARKTIREEMVS